MGDNSFSWIEYGHGYERPTFTASKNSGGSFVGAKAGYSAHVSTCNAETRFNKNLSCGFSGPSAGVFVGGKIGTENSIGANVEANLVSSNVKVGNTRVGTGLGLNSGVKLDRNGFQVGTGIGPSVKIETPIPWLG